MIVHPALTDDPVMLGSRSSSGAVHVGAPTPPADLVDQALATYINWREDQRAVADAYARWSDAPAAEHNLRLAAYTAALDQEQAAANVYAESIGELTRWLELHAAPAASCTQAKDLADVS